MSKNIEIAPSILAADFRHLEREVKAAQDAGADRIHCDVMDGHFVPNLSFGPMLVATVRKCVSIPLDVHLMISNPLDYIDRYVESGADTLTVHAEACSNIAEVFSTIKRTGARVGVSVNPDKSLSLFTEHLAMIDQVLIMTVYAGFGAQKFIAETLKKILAIHEEAKRRNLNLDIEVDGGIIPETAKLCAENGATVFVSGSYIFGHADYSERIDSLRRAVEEGKNKL
jgi:ribulose-phosphate 3-epimerase